MADDEIRVNAVEFDGDTVQIIYMAAPRMTAEGSAISTSNILTFARDTEPVRPIVEDMIDSIKGYVLDILAGLDEAHTMSLDEYEATLDGDDDLDDLGMGDD